MPQFAVEIREPMDVEIYRAVPPEEAEANDKPMEVDCEPDDDEGTVIHLRNSDGSVRTFYEEPLPRDIPVGESAGELFDRVTKRELLNDALNFIGSFAMAKLNDDQQDLIRDLVVRTATHPGLQSDTEDEAPAPSSPSDHYRVTPLQCLLMMDVIAQSASTEFMSVYPVLLGVRIDPDLFHTTKLRTLQLRKERQEIQAADERARKIKAATPSQRAGPKGTSRGVGLDNDEEPLYKGIEGTVREKNKQIILESDDDLLVDLSIRWLDMLNASQLQRVKRALVKEEPVEDAKNEEISEPLAPPPKVAKKEQAEDTKKESIEQPEESKPAEKIKQETSDQSEEPQKEKAYYITGNEYDSVLRETEFCFEQPACELWCGFYNQGFPCYPDHKHMFWHTKYRRQGVPNHKHSWHTDTDEEISLMVVYIQRHYNENVLEMLKELGSTTAFDCADPRMHPFEQEKSESRTSTALTKIENDFQKLEAVIFKKCPLPVQLQKYQHNVDYEADDKRQPIGDRPL